MTRPKLHSVAPIAFAAALGASCGGPRAQVDFDSGALGQLDAPGQDDRPAADGRPDSPDDLPPDEQSGGRDGSSERNCADDSLDKEGCPCSGSEPPRSCYPGDPATSGKGACRPGMQTCGGPTVSTWGECEGAVTPKPEDCANGRDDDCNGKTDCEDPACTTADSGSTCKMPESADAADVTGERAPEAGSEVSPEAGPDTPPGPRCDNGTCADGKTCVNKLNCLCGPICVAGSVRICDAYCGLFQQCNPDGSWGPCQYCYSAGGSCHCEVATCQKHADCSPGSWCDWSHEAYFPVLGVNGGCMSGFGGSCNSNADCNRCDPYGRCWATCWVEQHVCVHDCEHHSDCPAGSVCDLGACRPAPYQPFCLPLPPASCK